MKRIAVHGNTDSERLASLSGIVERICMLSHQSTMAVAPPVIPLSCSVDNPMTGDVLLKYFFPLKGRVTTVFSMLSGARKAAVSISIQGVESGRTRVVEFGDGVRESSVDIEVLPGDLMEIVFNQSENVVSDLSLNLAALIEVTLTHKQLKSVALDQVGLEDVI